MHSSIVNRYVGFLQHPLHQRTTMIPRQVCQLKHRYFACYTPTFPCHLAVKPGTVISALDFFKEKDPPVVLPRDEYPDWLGSLAVPLPTLAQLKKMPIEESTDYEQRRYLKLTRRQQIKANNEALKKK